MVPPTHPESAPQWHQYPQKRCRSRRNRSPPGGVPLWTAACPFSSSLWHSSPAPHSASAAQSETDPDPPAEIQFPCPPALARAGSWSGLRCEAPHLECPRRAELWSGTWSVSNLNDSTLSTTIAPIWLVFS